MVHVAAHLYAAIPLIVCCYPITVRRSCTSIWYIATEERKDLFPESPPFAPSSLFDILSHCITMQSYLNQVQDAEPYPDVLSVNEIARRKANLAGQTTAERKRQIYCEIAPGTFVSSSPTYICLEAEDQRFVRSSVMFDIDSIVGYPSSLAIAKQGIRWHPAQMAVSELQSSLHLNPIPVHIILEKSGLLVQIWPLCHSCRSTIPLDGQTSLP
jgi:hypothetical protein